METNIFFRAAMAGAFVALLGLPGTYNNPKRALLLAGALQRRFERQFAMKDFRVGAVKRGAGDESPRDSLRRQCCFERREHALDAVPPGLGPRAHVHETPGAHAPRLRARRKARTGNSTSQRARRWR